MASELEICNSALVKVGGKRITSLTEDNREAEVCNEQYSKLRDDVLRAHPWNFAIKRTELAQLAETPTYEFTYAYQLPVDCLRVLEFEERRVAFKIEGRKLLTNDSTAKVKYISQVTDVSQFDSMFKEALATRLAADIAYSLSQSISLTQQLLAAYGVILRDARSMDGQEGSVDEVFADEWLDSRF